MVCDYASHEKMDHYEYDILARLDKIFFNLNKMSQIICIQYS